MRQQQLLDGRRLLQSLKLWPGVFRLASRCTLQVASAAAQLNMMHATLVQLKFFCRCSYKFVCLRWAEEGRGREERRIRCLREIEELVTMRLVDIELH